MSVTPFVCIINPIFLYVNCLSIKLFRLILIQEFWKETFLKWVWSWTRNSSDITGKMQRLTSNTIIIEFWLQRITCGIYLESWKIWEFHWIQIWTWNSLSGNEENSFRILSRVWYVRHSIPFHRAKNITTSEWFEILYTFTTTCCKNILKIPGPTPSRKPHYGISKFSIFLVYSCFSNPETLDKIRIFSSSIWNFSNFSTF